jgi:hypothetical protein
MMRSASGNGIGFGGGSFRWWPCRASSPLR